MKTIALSMTNRVFLVLLAGVVLATALIVYAAVRDRQRLTREAQVQDMAEHLEALAQALTGADNGQKEAIARTARIFGLDIEAAPGIDGGTNANTPLVQSLKSRLADGRHVTILGQAECQAPQEQATPRYDACETLYVTLRDGVPLKLTMHDASQRLTPLPLTRQAAYVTVFLALTYLLTYLVAKMAAHPMKQLAAAATRLGEDVDTPALPEKGSTEARQAAMAFNAMRARIRRQIQHRTHMLAAITHDLQTPLTRLRLRLEKVGDPDLQRKLIDDLTTMQAMVRDGLDLARSMDSSEPRHLLDADSLLDSICADALDSGQNVSLEGRTEAFIAGQSNALRRCLANIIDNAVKYGHFARIKAIAEQDALIIRVRDGGPGIPDMHLEAVFDPFFRLEASRSRQTGGTGIGLTIARNVAQNNDGRLTLRNHPEGGLEVRIELPIKQFRAARAPEKTSASALSV